MPRLTGKLLIASPHLSDRNFFRTVVYVLRHEAEGAFGLVLNRPTEYRLADSVEEALGQRPLRDDVLFWGGPVKGPLTAIHCSAQFNEFDCGGGVYGTSDQEHLLQLINDSEVQARFFGGYSGWGEGQLDAELKAGGWMIAKANVPDDLFGNTAGLWESAVRRVGRSVFGNLMPRDQSFDPTVN